MWNDVVEYDNTQSAYWDSQLYNPGTIKTPSPPSNLRGSIFTVSWTRAAASGITEDVALFSFHLTMRPGTAGLGSSLDASDCANVESQFTASYWAPFASLTSAQWTLSEYIWRNFGADYPISTKTGYSKPGPVWRRTLVGTAGGDVGARVPDQVAQTVTLTTASRIHWGRVYIGGIPASALSVNEFGHATDARCDSLASSMRGFFNSIHSFARIIEPVIWSPKYRGWFNMKTLAVDDVFDIQRSRRSRRFQYKKIYTS